MKIDRAVGLALSAVFLLRLRPARGFVLLLALVAADTAWAVRIGERKDGGRLALDGYVHVQWNLAYFPNVAADRWQHHGFSLRRARARLDYEYGTRARTVLELGADDLRLELKDAFAAFRIGMPLRLVAGVQKMPFSREELCPASRLTMVERSRSNAFFDSLGFLGRDIGLIADGELSRLRLSYALGVFNGNRARSLRDDNDAKQFAGRLVFEPTERFSAGLNLSQRNDSLTGEPVTAAGGDLLVRLGRASLELEGLVGEAGAATALGVWLTGSARLGVLEPVLRLERLAADCRRPETAQTTIAAGVNWHLQERIRLKANVGTGLTAEPDASRTLVVEAQAGF